MFVNLGSLEKFEYAVNNLGGKRVLEDEQVFFQHLLSCENKVLIFSKEMQESEEPQMIFPEEIPTVMEESEALEKFGNYLEEVFYEANVLIPACFLTEIGAVIDMVHLKIMYMNLGVKQSMVMDCKSCVLDGARYGDAPPLVIPLGRRCMDQRKICSAALKAGSWRRSLQLLQEAQISMVALRRTLTDSVSTAEFSHTENCHRAEAAQVPLNLRVYTALIGACRSRWQAAIHLLRRLQGEQQEGDAVLYSRCISAGLKGKRWQLAFGLLEELDCAGIERDLFIFNAAISACEAANSWPAALRFLAVSRVSDVVSLTSTIAACEKFRAWTITLALLVWAQGAWAQANLVTHNTCVSACSKAAGWPQALGVLHDITADLISYNSVTSGLGKALLWQEAMQMLGSLQANSLVADGFSYSAVIHTCGLAGLWLQACALAAVCPRDGVVRNSALEACAKGSQWRAASQLFLGQPERPSRGRFVGLFKALSGARQWARALCLLQEAGEEFGDTIAWNTVTRCALEADAWPAALAVLAHMELQLLRTDTRMYAETLGTLGRNTQWQLCWSLCQTCQPDMYMCTTSATAALRAGSWQAVFWQFQLGGSQFDAVARNLAISACDTGSQWWGSFGILDSFEVYELEIDVVTLTSVMSACEKSARWPHAVCLFRQLADLDLAATDVTYGVAASAFAKGKCIKAASRTLGTMCRQRMSATIAYNGVLNACSTFTDWKTALAVYRQSQSKGVHPDDASHLSVLSTCGTAGQWQASSHFLQIEAKAREANRVMQLNTVIDACVPFRWARALAQLRGLPQQLVQGSHVTYAVVLSELPWRMALFLLEPGEVVEVQHSALRAAQRGTAWTQQLALLRPGDSIAFNLLLKALPWQKALLRLQGDRRLDVYSYSAVISTCAEAAQWQHALQLVAFMQQKEAHCAQWQDYWPKSETHKADPPHSVFFTPGFVACQEFPHISFRHASVMVNFGKTPAAAPASTSRKRRTHSQVVLAPGRDLSFLERAYARRRPLTAMRPPQPEQADGLESDMCWSADLAVLGQAWDDLADLSVSESGGYYLSVISSVPRSFWKARGGEGGPSYKLQLTRRSKRVNSSEDKCEVMLPVAFPDEGTFEWLDSFIEKNPQYTELSDRKLMEWAVASGLNRPKVGPNARRPIADVASEEEEGLLANWHCQTVLWAYVSKRGAASGRYIRLSWLSELFCCDGCQSEHWLMLFVALKDLLAQRHEAVVRPPGITKQRAKLVVPGGKVSCAPPDCDVVAGSLKDFLQKVDVLEMATRESVVTVEIVADALLPFWVTPTRNMAGKLRPCFCHAKSSSDKPNYQYGLPSMDNGLSGVVQSISSLQPRNYIIMEVKSNLVAEERAQILKRFPSAQYKKVAHVVMGEPDEAASQRGGKVVLLCKHEQQEYKQRVRKKILKIKQDKENASWRIKKAQQEQKKRMAQQQKEMAEKRHHSLPGNW
ncbi:unnamed protein product [Effrenium voratum]|nr:unnamed protein product [Effrenium voratum]